MTKRISNLMAFPSSSVLGLLQTSSVGLGILLRHLPKLSTRVVVGQVVSHSFVISCMSRIWSTDTEIVDSDSIDGFPFVGAVPNRDGHFMAAGYSGHGECSSPPCSIIGNLLNESFRHAANPTFYCSSSPPNSEVSRNGLSGTSAGSIVPRYAGSILSNG